MTYILPGIVSRMVQGYPGIARNFWFVVCGLWFVVCGLWFNNGRRIFYLGLGDGRTQGPPLHFHRRFRGFLVCGYFFLNLRNFPFRYIRSSSFKLKHTKNNANNNTAVPSYMATNHKLYAGYTTCIPHRNPTTTTLGNSDGVQIW